MEVHWFLVCPPVWCPSVCSMPLHLSASVPTCLFVNLLGYLRGGRPHFSVSLCLLSNNNERVHVDLAHHHLRQRAVHRRERGSKLLGHDW